MTEILKFAAFGKDIPDPQVHDRDVMELLSKLEERLRSQGHTWQDVSLLVIANSKDSVTHDAQRESDRNIVTGIDRFCRRHGWFPSLLGTTVFSSFYADQGEVNKGIDNGLLFIAVLSTIVQRIPVVHEVSGDTQARRNVGVNVIQECINSLRAQIVDERGVNPARIDVLDSSLGILFTSGSGHVEERGFIDFTDSYAIGQELLGTFPEGLKIVGGCSTNRRATLSQCIYYSYAEESALRYDFSYNHCAAAALLPCGSTRLFLEHPYVVADSEPLRLIFSERNSYAPGRYFCIRSINEKNPIEFLANYWGLSEAELYEMLEKHTAIPAESRTFTHTISSSKTATETAWPNVPIWFERDDDPDRSVLLRLVRAEPEDAPYYLMAMAPPGQVPKATSPDRPDAALKAIELNCTSLAKYFDDEMGGAASMLSFICESRKVLLNDFGSNVEAESLIALLPSPVMKIGIYLNGEYSTGNRKAIGYHNFSQITAIIPPRHPGDLPFSLKM